MFIPHRDVVRINILKSVKCSASTNDRGAIDVSWTERGTELGAVQ